MFPVTSRFPLPTPTLVSTWQIPGDENGFNAGINCPVEERRLKIRVSHDVKTNEAAQKTLPMNVLEMTDAWRTLLRTLSTMLGPVFRKPISANPGLKVNRGFYFSCLKMFAKANFKLEMKKSQSRN